MRFKQQFVIAGIAHQDCAALRRRYHAQQLLGRLLEQQLLLALSSELPGQLTQPC